MASIPLPLLLVFQHTAARRRLGDAACRVVFQRVFQHTAARRRLGRVVQRLHPHTLFQHTAARRRLANMLGDLKVWVSVSTHSRPKAAGMIK